MWMTVAVALGSAVAVARAVRVDDGRRLRVSVGGEEAVTRSCVPVLLSDSVAVHGTPVQVPDAVRVPAGTAVRVSVTATTVLVGVRVSVWSTRDQVAESHRDLVTGTRVADRVSVAVAGADALAVRRAAGDGVRVGDPEAETRGTPVQVGVRVRVRDRGTLDQDGERVSDREGLWAAEADRVADRHAGAAAVAAVVLPRRWR